MKGKKKRPKLLRLDELVEAMREEATAVHHLTYGRTRVVFVLDGEGANYNLQDVPYYFIAKSAEIVAEMSEDYPNKPSEDVLNIHLVPRWG